MCLGPAAPSSPTLGECGLEAGEIAAARWNLSQHRINQHRAFHTALSIICLAVAISRSMESVKFVLRRRHADATLRNEVMKNTANVF